MGNKAGLSDKHSEFVKAYLANGRNGTQAAIAAGYSENTASSQASRLLKNVNVIKIVESHKEKIQHKFNITLDGQLEKLQECIKGAKEEAQFSAAISGIKVQNELAGIEPPKKLDITSEGTLTCKVVFKDTDKKEN